MTDNVNTREIALNILMEIDDSSFTHVVLNEALAKYKYLDKQERSFISRIVRGTIERRITLDYVIDTVSSVKTAKMKPLIRNLMRMSVYQLMYMDGIPESAVCNEAVKIARQRKFVNLTGFVNGVLRNVLRKLPDITMPNDTVRYSMPENVMAMLGKVYGEDAASIAAKAFLKEKQLSVCTNTTKCTKEELKGLLAASGIKAEDTGYLDRALYLSGYDYLEGIEAFEHGYFHVQDISSMISGIVTAPLPGQNIIDLCAAPGGKSIFAALSMENNGRIDAGDISERKVMLMEENVDRLGLDIINLHVWSAAEFNQELAGSADIVIADVPCSGLGIIGRKPDIKYGINDEKLGDIVKLQRQIIDNGVKYLKPGGIFIFSTCTLNPAENEENVDYIKGLGFDGCDLAGLLPQKVLDDFKKAGDEVFGKVMTDIGNGYITLWPGINECDGFFVARLKKKE